MSANSRKLFYLVPAALACVFLSCALASGQVLITNLHVGSNPVAVAVNPQTNKIYVVNQYSNSVTVIDGVSNATTTVAVGALPTALAINQVTNTIYVANGNANTVTVIDGATNRTTTVTVGLYPAALDVNPVTNKIYVANSDSNSVTIIDGATNATNTVAVGRHPWPVAVNAVTNKVYIGNRGDGTVSVLDGSTNTVRRVLVDSGPRAIAINTVANQFYAANYDSGTVSVIDGSTYAVASVPVGTSPASLAVDAIRNKVYVANSGGNTATIIDPTTLTTSTITVGLAPNAVDIDAITGRAYFTNLDNNGSVTVISEIDLSTVKVTVGRTPEAIAVNPLTNRVYTANEGNNTVSVLSGANADPLQFTNVPPCRLVDTRQPTGPFGGPAIPGGTSRSFALPQSGCGIPATALAYALNVTVVPTRALRYLTIWPTGEPQPGISTLNSPDARVKANAAIVPAGTAGAVTVFVTDTTDVILDIVGYFRAPDSQTLQFYPLLPCRVADTRNQPGHLGGPYLRGTRERDFPVLESGCQVPSTAQAYSMNFTAVPWQGKSLTYLSTWAAGNNQPLVSTLNNPTATVVANAAIVPAGTGGAIAVYPSQDTDLVVDIDGYFAAPGTGGMSLYPTAPCRVLDTRASGGPFTGQRSPVVDVAASSCGIAVNAKAYTFNATVVPTTPLGYLTLWPDGQPLPLASTLNARDGAVTSNMAILPNQNGKVDAYAFGTTQLILDISSYFAP